MFRFRRIPLNEFRRKPIVQRFNVYRLFRVSQGAIRRIIGRVVLLFRTRRPETFYLLTISLSVAPVIFVLEKQNGQSIGLIEIHSFLSIRFILNATFSDFYEVFYEEFQKYA